MKGNKDDRTITVSAHVGIRQTSIGETEVIKVLIDSLQMSVTSYNIYFHVHLCSPDILG